MNKKHLKLSATKIIFAIGFGLFLISGTAILINMSDLRWTVCYEWSAYSQGSNRCDPISPFVVPAIFIMLISVGLHFLKFDQMKVKKKTLIISFVGALIFLSPVFFYGMLDCYNNDQLLCSRSYQSASMVFVPFLPLFLFSLVTYWMRQGVFDYWMKFAIWAVPVMMCLTYLILGGASQGGLGIESSYGDSFDAFLFMLLYGSFIGISIWRIVHAYRMK